MPETIEKLRPDRDLQCYFERPSAVAALSEAGPGGFTVSGTWRQQFDWAVVEWNQHNVFEHPAFRSLPDGDLSGLVLTYDEERENCIPLDSDLYPTVEWDALRIWTRVAGVEDFYVVDLRSRAAPLAGSWTPAQAEFELTGTVTAGDHVGLAFLGEHHTYLVTASDTLATAVQAIADSVNAFSPVMKATTAGAAIRLYYVGVGGTLLNSTTGANGNRIGAYGHVSGARTEVWSPAWARFSGGTSPVKWRVTIPFGSLVARDGRTVPTHSIRKMRWTYAAQLQGGAFARGEFRVRVSNWTVTGTGRAYQVSGPASRRAEDDSREVQYSGPWQRELGNFSGGSIHSTSANGAKAEWQYMATAAHRLYVGARFLANGASIQIRVDGGAPQTVNLAIPGEDQLVRLPAGTLAAGSHTVEVTHIGAAGQSFYFDFFEVCIPVPGLPALPSDGLVTLATDWDTDHSIAVAPERTAWMMHSLGFHGRVNHYVGALWFYELAAQGYAYASATVDFVGTPVFGETTTVRIGRVGEPPESDTVIPHLNLIGDTAETIARAFELELNRGYTAIRAEASGNRLTVLARAIGAGGDEITISASPAAGAFQAVVSGATLAGGVTGEWRTDVAAVPRLNRAARDWSRAFFVALQSLGLDAAAAFSMELQHGDPSVAAGIAQRYPNGEAVTLNTPALQTNFSPESMAYWRQVYLEMGQLMQAAGLQPYLQFGEVQWWYFAKASIGMPFYDAYTMAAFQSLYGRPMAVIPSEHEDPALYPDEVALLPTLIGQFTANVMAYVRGVLPGCRFEVLYPTDVNETALNTAINYPPAHWTSAVLDCLKTESFTYTNVRNLDLARGTVEYGASRGFPQAKRSFLVGIGDSTSAWLKEVDMARSQRLESIVLFALDQYCLIGYETPARAPLRRSAQHGV